MTDNQDFATTPTPQPVPESMIIDDKARPSGPVSHHIAGQHSTSTSGQMDPTTHHTQTGGTHDPTTGRDHHMSGTTETGNKHYNDPNSKYDTSTTTGRIADKLDPTSRRTQTDSYDNTSSTGRDHHMSGTTGTGHTGYNDPTSKYDTSTATGRAADKVDPTSHHTQTGTYGAGAGAGAGIGQDHHMTGTGTHHTGYNDPNSKYDTSTTTGRVEDKLDPTSRNTHATGFGTSGLNTQTGAYDSTTGRDHHMSGTTGASHTGFNDPTSKYDTSTATGRAADKVDPTSHHTQTGTYGAGAGAGVGYGAVQDHHMTGTTETGRTGYNDPNSKYNTATTKGKIADKVDPTSRAVNDPTSKYDTSLPAGIVADKADPTSRQTHTGGYNTLPGQKYDTTKTTGKIANKIDPTTDSRGNAPNVGHTGQQAGYEHSGNHPSAGVGAVGAAAGAALGVRGAHDNKVVDQQPGSTTGQTGYGTTGHTGGSSVGGVGATKMRSNSSSSSSSSDLERSHGTKGVSHNPNARTNDPNSESSGGIMDKIKNKLHIGKTSPESSPTHTTTSSGTAAAGGAAAGGAAAAGATAAYNKHNSHDPKHPSPSNAQNKATDQYGDTSSLPHSEYRSSGGATAASAKDPSVSVGYTDPTSSKLPGKDHNTKYADYADTGSSHLNKHDNKMGTAAGATAGAAAGAAGASHGAHHTPGNTHDKTSTLGSGPTAYGTTAPGTHSNTGTGEKYPSSIPGSYPEKPTDAMHGSGAQSGMPNTSYGSGVGQQSYGTTDHSGRNAAVGAGVGAGAGALAGNALAGEHQKHTGTTQNPTSQAYPSHTEHSRDVYYDNGSKDSEYGFGQKSQGADVSPTLAHSKGPSYGAGVQHSTLDPSNRDISTGSEAGNTSGGFGARSGNIPVTQGGEFLSDKERNLVTEHFQNANEKLKPGDPRVAGVAVVPLTQEQMNEATPRSSQKYQSPDLTTDESATHSHASNMKSKLGVHH